MLAAHLARLKRRGDVRRYAVDPAMQNYLRVALRGLLLPRRIRGLVAQGGLGDRADLVGGVTGSLMQDHDPGDLAALLDLLQDADGPPSLVSNLAEVLGHARGGNLGAFEPGRFGMVPPYTPFSGDGGHQPGLAVDELTNALRPRGAVRPRLQQLRPGLMTMNLGLTADLHDLLDQLHQTGIPRGEAARQRPAVPAPVLLDNAQHHVGNALLRSANFMVGGGR